MDNIRVIRKRLLRVMRGYALLSPHRDPDPAEHEALRHKASSADAGDPVRDGHRCPLAVLVSLRFADDDPDASRIAPEVLGADYDQLRPPERTGETDGEHRARLHRPQPAICASGVAKCSISQLQ